MYPELFQIGQKTIYAYGVMILLGGFIGYFLLAAKVKKTTLPFEWVTTSYLICLIFGYIGSRIQFEITGGGGGSASTGFELFGALFGAVLSFYLMNWKSRKRFGEISDAMAPTVAIGIFFGRLGCFASGCCWGRACPIDFSLGVKFPPHKIMEAPTDVYLHPVQLYEASIVLLIFFFLEWRYRSRLFFGQVFSEFVIFYGVSRFVIEFFRGDQKYRTLFFEDTLSLTQILMLLAVVVSSWFWCRKLKEARLT